MMRWKRRRWLGLMLLLLLMGCSSDRPRNSSGGDSPTKSADATSARGQDAGGMGHDDGGADVGAESGSSSTASGPIDLLHAVATVVATSSAIRNEVKQVKRLVDGDLETGWNSRPGDLIGSWIAFRLPDEAEVDSLEMTAGMTRHFKGRDLFALNFRLRQVLVSREGKTLGIFPLDVKNRNPQKIQVKGKGGDWRIEVLGVLTGGRADWRETCSTDLKVFGRAPGAKDGAYHPAVTIGSLPPRASPRESELIASVPPIEGTTAQKRALFKKLAKTAIERHHTAVRGVGGTVVTDRSGKQYAFYLYEYGSFESWQGALKATGQWQKTQAKAKAIQESCLSRYDTKLERDRARSEKLMEIIDNSEDEAEVEAALKVINTLYVDEEYGPACNGMEKLFPGVWKAKACSPDKTVMVIYEVTGGDEGFEVGRLISETTTPRCHAAEVEHEMWYGEGDEDAARRTKTIPFMVLDLDRDDEREVLVQWQRGEYLTTGRGGSVNDYESSSQYVKIYRANGEVQLALDLDLFNTRIAHDIRRKRSSWTKMWLEDVTGDGHVDVVRDETVFDGFCSCEDIDALKLAPGKSEEWRPPGPSQWYFNDVACIGDSEYFYGEEDETECAVLSSKRGKVIAYDSAADLWR